MIVLGIHDGHNCGVSLFIENKLKFAFQRKELVKKMNMAFHLNQFHIV